MELAARITRMPIPHEPERGHEAAGFLPHGPVRDLAAAAAAGSPHLAGLLGREREWAAGALAGPPEAARDALLAEAEAAEGDPGPVLRRVKRRMALLAALADLGGAWSLEEVTGALTALADRAVEAALGHAVAREAARGRLPEAPGAFVLAMGKMGAWELNYSSDIDLICLFDAGRHAPSEQAGVKAGLVRAVRATCRTLSDVGPEGYVFRTDLRLRPDPSVTPVILPTDAAERYYESLARTWERAAYVKARPCAGDLAAGGAFLERLRPFVWRRHLDFAAIEDVHALVRRIRDHRGDGGPIAAAGHDLKRGPGGIRAVELTAQSHQLIFGGRDERLRARGTVDALARLAEAGRLPEDAAGELAEDYRALRETEHRLQMVRDAQTHAVPSAPDEVLRVARLHGEADPADFLAGLTARLARVDGWSRRLMGGGAAPRPCPEVPERWASYPALRSARARDGFERIAAPLMERIRAAPRPEEALAVFDRFLAGLPAGAQLFALFEANPPLMDLIVDIASSAPGLAAHLSRRPGVLDAVIAGGFFTRWPGEDALARDLAAAMERERDHEARLDAARRWAAEWRFRVGVHHLRGLVDGDEAGAQYAEVAGAALRALMPVVAQEVARRHGPAPGRGAVALGMGSLGARWLHAGSDLDLILVYDAAGVEASEGPRPLAARAWYARLAQTLVTGLTAPMAQGRLYEVDMRLRPSGRQGPLATSLAGFRDYQREEAWTWERLALTRARPVAGPGDLSDELDVLRTEILGPAAASRADRRGRGGHAPPPRGGAAAAGPVGRARGPRRAPGHRADRPGRRTRRGTGGPRDGRAARAPGGAPTGPCAPAPRAGRLGAPRAGGVLAGGGRAGGTEMLLREAAAADVEALERRIGAARGGGRLGRRGRARRDGAGRVGGRGWRSRTPGASCGRPTGSRASARPSAGRSSSTGR